MLRRLRRDIEENHRNVVDSTRHAHESVRLEQERRYAGEMDELKERLRLEKQTWEENAIKQQEMMLANRERELREQMKHERDREIEKIIARFETDTTVTKEETERTADNRVKYVDSESGCESTYSSFFQGVFVRSTKMNFVN